MAAKLPLVIVGAGSIGQRHIDCALNSDSVTLDAVVEPMETARAALAKRGLPVVAHLNDVPKSTRAALIATPTPDHATTALSCVENGWPTLVEKPLTQTLDEATALCAAADKAGVPLITGHHRRCHPFVTHARAQMSVLGQITAIQGLWALRKHDDYFTPDWRRTAGAGPILTNLSHEIDLLICLAGAITQVTAMTANAARGFDVEDTAAITLRFASGALGTFTLSDAGVSPWAFEAATGENPKIDVRGPDPLRFIGTKGAMGFPSLTKWRGRDWQVDIYETPAPIFKEIDGIAAQLDRFAQVAQGGSDPILATGHDGRATMAVIDAIQHAAQTGQTCDVAP